jgi:hypothetical protein
MDDERVKRNFESLLAKLRQSGDLPGLEVEMESNEPLAQLAGCVAIGLKRGSETVATALIRAVPASPISFLSDEVTLMGFEAAEELASRIGVGFISKQAFAGLLARLVVTRSIPPAKTEAALALANGEKLKAYFQQEMAGVVVDVRQTDSDFHTGLTSFFFHNEGEPSLGWLWCIKVPTGVLADLETGGIIGVLEHYGWRERLRDAPAGTILFATAHGLDVWNPRGAPNP